MGNATLLIRKVPNGTTTEDIRKFIMTGSSWKLRFFLKITNLSILTAVDKVHKDTESHCLVTIEPDTIADTLIKRLHARHLNGRRVPVKRYYERNPMNERRKNLKANLAHSSDNRGHERRRQEVLTFGDEKTKALIRKLI